MLRRVTSILLCFSLLGLTVLPAAYLPCCCKAAMKPKPLKVASCCSHYKPQTQGCGLVAQARTMACCESGVGPSSLQDRMAKGSFHCAGKVLNKTCPICRCLEQMQIVAIAGSQTHETVVRVAAAALPSAVVPMSELPLKSVEVAPQGERPGIAVTLQTCSFRC
jgi:hypothetical protein